MFERFTQPARQSVIAAQQEARGLGAARIVPAHLLLAVVATAESAGSALADLLARDGLTTASLRTELREIAPGPELGGEDAAALRSIGIDLQSVRDAVDATFGAGTLDATVPPPRRGLFGSRPAGHIPFSGGAKGVLELSLREAVSRKDGFIGPEHIFLGVLRSTDPTALKLIKRHTSPEVLATGVRRLLDAAA